MSDQSHPGGWIGKLIIAIFLLGVGAMINQFWNVPFIMGRQDSRLNQIEKHLEYNDKRMDEFVDKLDDIKKISNERRRR